MQVIELVNDIRFFGFGFFVYTKGERNRSLFGLFYDKEQKRIKIEIVWIIIG